MSFWRKARALAVVLPNMFRAHRSDPHQPPVNGSDPPHQIHAEAVNGGDVDVEEAVGTLRGELEAANALVAERLMETNELEEHVGAQNKKGYVGQATTAAHQMRPKSPPSLTRRAPAAMPASPKIRPSTPPGRRVTSARPTLSGCDC